MSLTLWKRNLSLFYHKINFGSMENTVYLRYLNLFYFKTLPCYLFSSDLVSLCLCFMFKTLQTHLCGATELPLLLECYCIFTFLFSCLELRFRIELPCSSVHGTLKLLVCARLFSFNVFIFHLLSLSPSPFSTSTS